MSYFLAYRDPKQLKRDVRGVVLCVAAFILTMNIVATFVFIFAVFYEHPDLLWGYQAQASSLSWNRDLSEALMDVTVKYSGLASLLGMLCGLPWFFIIRGKKFATTDVTHTNSKVKIGTIAFMFVLIMAIQFFMSLVGMSLDAIFPQDSASATDTLDEATVNLGTTFWGVLYLVFLGPICEELVFRGAVMRTLEKYGANFAIIVSSLLFGLYHIILFQAVFAFLAGLVFAYVAGRFSIKWAILLHMLNNGMAALSIALNSQIFDAALGMSYMVCFVVAIIVLIVFRRKLVMQKRAGAPSELRVYERAFSSPWIIIYIVLCVLGGIQIILGF